MLEKADFKKKSAFFYIFNLRMQINKVSSLQEHNIVFHKPYPHCICDDATEEEAQDDDEAAERDDSADEVAEAEPEPHISADHKDQAIYQQLRNRLTTECITLRRKCI